MTQPRRQSLTLVEPPGPEPNPFPSGPGSGDGPARAYPPFEDFYRQFAPKASRYAAAIVGPDAAQDACQDAWARIWRAWGRSRPDRVEAWALRVVRNCCFDQRRRDRRPEGSGSGMDFPSPLQVEDHVVARLESDAALQVLVTLPDALRETLWLREIGDLPYHEIAEIQGVPIGTVMSRLNAGRKKVAATLRRQGR